MASNLLAIASDLVAMASNLSCITRAEVETSVTASRQPTHHRPPGSRTTEHLNQRTNLTEIQQVTLSLLDNLAVAASTCSIPFHNFW